MYNTASLVPTFEAYRAPLFNAMPPNRDTFSPTDVRNNYALGHCYNLQGLHYPLLLE